MRLRAMLKHPGRRVFIGALALVAAVLGSVAWYIDNAIDPLSNIRWTSETAPIKGSSHVDVEPPVPSAPRNKTDTPATQGSVAAIPPVPILESALPTRPGPARTEVVFTVQVAAFENHARAAKLANRISAAGHPALVKKGMIANGEAIYRVQLARQFDRGAASLEVETLKKKVPGVVPIVVLGRN